MIKEFIGIGDTPEEALLNAKTQIGLSENDEVDFEVIQMPEKKVLGLFGGKQAKVKITIKSGPAEAAEEYLRSVIDAMGLKDLTITVDATDEGATFNIEGEDVGFVIGRRGETLDALQSLVKQVANRADNSYYKITLNTGNYREKREKTLEILGRKLAYKAVKTGKKQPLEPMNPYERRIIHTSVQKVKGAISWSEGENAARHVVIGPDPKERRNRGYGNRRGSSNRGSRPAPNPNRKPLDESNGAGLYGRID